LEDLYIRATGGFTVRLNATEYVNITGCTIETSSAASTANIPVVASASATSYSMSTAGEQYLTISDNTTIGGYFAMTFYGSSGSQGATHDVEISNNTITDAYYYGVYVYYARNIKVLENTIGNFTNNYNYGAYMGYIDGGIFSKNMVDSITLFTLILGATLQMLHSIVKSLTTCSRTATTDCECTTVLI